MSIDEKALEKAKAAYASFWSKNWIGDSMRHAIEAYEAAKTDQPDDSTSEFEDFLSQLEENDTGMYWVSARQELRRLWRLGAPKRELIDAEKVRFVLSETREALAHAERRYSSNPWIIATLNNLERQAAIAANEIEGEKA